MRVCGEAKRWGVRKSHGFIAVFPLASRQSIPEMRRPSDEFLLAHFENPFVLFLASDDGHCATPSLVLETRRNNGMSMFSQVQWPWYLRRWTLLGRRQLRGSDGIGMFRARVQNGISMRLRLENGH